jgi:hypothetical protein
LPWLIRGSGSTDCAEFGAAECKKWDEGVLQRREIKLLSVVSKKLVSVIVPSCKTGQFIGEALQSVEAQTHPHWEVIVVDDAGAGGRIAERLRAAD